MAMARDFRRMGKPAGSLRMKNADGSAPIAKSPLSCAGFLLLQIKTSGFFAHQRSVEQPAMVVPGVALVGGELALGSRAA